MAFDRFSSFCYSNQPLLDALKPSRPGHDVPWTPLLQALIVIDFMFSTKKQILWLWQKKKQVNSQNVDTFMQDTPNKLIYYLLAIYK